MRPLWNFVNSNSVVVLIGYYRFYNQIGVGIKNTDAVVFVIGDKGQRFSVRTTA